LSSILPIPRRWLGLALGAFLGLTAECNPPPRVVGTVRRDVAASPHTDATTGKTLIPERGIACGIRECVNQAPGSLCGPIWCSEGKTQSKKFGFIRNRSTLFRNHRLRTQFLSKGWLVYDAPVACIVRMAPTRKVGEYVVWVDFKVHEDGHLSLHSARNVDEVRRGKQIPRGPVNDKTQECIRRSLVGATLYDPNYVDDSPCSSSEADCTPTPVTRFPETILEFNVLVSNNDALEWP
jgi:hypothetical protein